MHVQQYFHASISRITNDCVQSRHLGGIERAVQSGLNTLPAEGNPNEGQPFALVISKLSVIRVDIIDTVGSRKGVRVELASRQVNSIHERRGPEGRGTEQRQMEGNEEEEMMEFGD